MRVDDGARPRSSTPAPAGAYPPDGAGLEQFPVAVTDGDVIVDINRTAEREAQPHPSTTSSVVESGIPRSSTTT